MENKERFLRLVAQVDREGMDNLMQWLDGSDFFTAPASTKYHEAYEGGLLEHSLNVYDEFKRIAAVYPNVEIPEESIIITTLFHDICKANTYATEKRNRKVDGRWESYDAYTFQEKFPFGGHGSKSVFILQQFVRLTPEEAVAINCHMGAYDMTTYSNPSAAYEKFPLAWLVHIADESATFMLTGKEE